MPLFKVSSQSYYKDGGGSDAEFTATVFIVADDSKKAKEKAIEQFKLALIDNGFDPLKVLKYRAKGLEKIQKEQDARIITLADGIKGNVSISECLDGISRVEFC